jgi:hypothetical protein
MATELIFRKNPNFGQPGEPEMLPVETVTHDDPVTEPRILSKTAFQDYAVSQLGGSVTGMARFTAIMDATRDSASGTIRFAFARYEAAVIFEKNNTGALTSLMVSAGVMTADERTAILGNWPTS